MSYALRAWAVAFLALVLASAGGVALASGWGALTAVLWLLAFVVVGVALEQSEIHGITETLELVDVVEDLRDR